MSNLTYDFDGLSASLFIADGTISRVERRGGLVVHRDDVGEVLLVEVPNVLAPLKRSDLDALVTHDAVLAKAVDEFLRRRERVIREHRRKQGFRGKS